MTISSFFKNTFLQSLAAIAVLFITAVVVGAQESPPLQQPGFRGGLNQTKDAAKPHPVRNDVAQPGEEVVTLRYFRIKKGSFDEFLKVSIEGVWPYFEKLGSRVIGMWKVITPEGVDGAPAASKEYDEVYLSTPIRKHRTLEGIAGCSRSRRQWSGLDQMQSGS